MFKPILNPTKKVNTSLRDVKKWYSGCHLLAHANDGRIVEVTEKGDKFLLNVQKIVFLEGKIYDVIITQSGPGKMTVFTLKSSVLREVFEITGQMLHAAHFAVDRILILVLDGTAYGVDLALEKPPKCPLLSFSVPSDAKTVVFSHYFYAWTRSAMYRVDLLQEPLSPFKTPSPIKVSLNPPLEMEQELCIVKGNAAVTMSPSVLAIYDAAGQIIYEERLEEQKSFVTLDGATSAACVFVLGDTLYTLKNHVVVRTQIHPQNIDKLLFIGSDGYLLVSDGSLVPFNSPEVLTPQKAGKLIVNSTGPVVTIIGKEIVQNTIKNFAKAPATYGLGSWFRKTSGLHSYLFRPFLYQYGGFTFVWRLEDGINPEIRLHSVDFNGLSKPITCYSTLRLSQATPNVVVWKVSVPYVALQINDQIHVMDGMTGLVKSSTKLGQALEMKNFHYYGTRKILITLGPQGGKQVTEVLHYEMDTGKVVVLGKMLLELTITETYCHPAEGFLVALDHLHKKAVIVFPPEHPSRLSPIVQENVYAVAQEETLYIVFADKITKYVNGKFIPYSDISKVDLGEIQRFYVGTKKSVLIGASAYACGSPDRPDSQGIVSIENKLDEYRVLMPNSPKEDPDERTILIYNQQFMWHVETPENMYKTPRTNGTGLENAVVISPCQLVQGLTLLHEGAFIDKTENCLVSFVV